MKGLLKKDFYNMFKNKIYLFMLGYIVLVVAALYITKSPAFSAFVSVMAALIITIGTIDEDQKGNIYLYLKGLPINEETIVISKFLFVFLIFIYCLAVNLLSIFIFNSVGMAQIDGKTMLLVFVLFLYFYLVTSGQVAISLTLPPSYRSLTFALFGLLPPLIAKIISKLNLVNKESAINFIRSLETTGGRMKLVIILILLSIIILFIVYKLAVKFLKIKVN